MTGLKIKTEILFKEVNMTLKTVEGSVTAIGDKVLVSEMDFGEQVTASGLIISGDDGKTRGIYPRWGKVYSKGPKNTDPYEAGDWILIEHGRWTRGITMGDGHEVRMVENKAILAWNNEPPQTGLRIGEEFADGAHATVDPSSFVNSSNAIRG